MNRNRIRTWMLAIVVGLLFVWVIPGSGQHETERVLVGSIVAVDWDDDGDVVAIDFQTEDEGRFAIDLDSRSLRLLSMVDENVEIVGSVFVGEDGWEYFSVRSFRVLPTSV